MLNNQYQNKNKKLNLSLLAIFLSTVTILDSSILNADNHSPRVYSPEDIPGELPPTSPNPNPSWSTSVPFVTATPVTSRTPTISSSPVYSSSITSSPRTTPSATPTPEELCQYMAINIHQTNINGKTGGLDPKNYQQIRALGRETQVGVCLNSKLDEALAFCEGTNGISVNNSGSGYMDDCIMEIFMGSGFYQYLHPNKSYYLDDLQKRSNPANNRWLDKSKLPKNYGFAKSCSVYHHDGKNFIYESSPAINNQCLANKPVDSRRMVNSVAEGKLYLDKNCNSVNYEPKIEENCSENMYYRSSPISLIFNEEDFELNKSSLVSFELDKSRPNNRYCEWKASSSAPLLVFDPENLGKITSADQLFGDWTFGGKSQASMDNKSVANSKWTNGFEALGSLDSNYDDKISGQELDNLSLWFDNNSNGISEEGEVKKISSLGIVNLYYKNTKVNNLTKDLFIDIGFDRIVSGKLVSGKAVDWYSKTSSSASKLIDDNIASLEKLYPETKIEVKTKDNISKINQDKLISGIWSWKSLISNNGKQDVFGGLLILDGHDDIFEGYSLNERSLGQKVSQNDLTEVSMFKLSGEKTNKGNYTFTSFKDGNRIKSLITVAKNGTELEGKTIVTSKTGSLSYHWIAVRK